MTDSVADRTTDQGTDSKEERLVLKGRSKSWAVGGRTLIMGVLNVTPDSFYDGGRYLDRGLALERAHRMVAEGADLIDVGGESTRPGATPVEVDEELRRVIPVVEEIAKAGIAVSVDTSKATVAERALGAGAEVVNDITALEGDPRMAGVCAASGAAVVLMHMRGTPETMQRDVVYTDIVLEVRTYLEARVKFAIESGIAVDRIAIDPGIGFGKSAEGSLELLRRLGEFTSLGAPLLVGLSRKSFIGLMIGEEAQGAESSNSDARLVGTIAASAAAIMNGAQILRVHDVKETREAALVADSVKRPGA
ncbi:MAG: dihydropteroate synthase [Proteobacteria bacterium]|nr:dihydropteroate synthase [Pseudomonadota bacterium]